LIINGPLLKAARIPWLVVVGLVSLGSSACHADKDASSVSALLAKEVAPGVQRIGSIRDPRITESSGVAASRQFPGVFWTHNDGDKPYSYTLFAINREGGALRDFQLTGTQLHDWEDIAIDDQRHLYVGDIGNNDARRFLIAVHEIDEPDPKGAKAVVKVNRTWQLRFPKLPFDCESLFVWEGFGYVVSKVFNDAKAEIYRFPLTNQTAPFTLELVTRLKIDSPVTGADISPDGKLLGLVAKSGPFVYQINGDVLKAGKVKPVHTKFKHEHIEGCCFMPEGLLATAENREIFLFTNPAFHPTTGQ
jgi:hypothetical protein